MDIFEKLKRERIRTVILFSVFCAILFACQWALTLGSNESDVLVTTQEVVQ